MSKLPTKSRNPNPAAHSTSAQAQAATAAPAAPAATSTSTKPAAVALARPAGAAGSKNGNCAAAWGFYNSNPALPRAQAVQQCVAATGMPVATARTQYQHWYTAAKLAAQAAQAKPAQ
jgi:hypothetical protein